MKRNILFLIVILSFNFDLQLNVCAQEAKWITAVEDQSETNTWLGFRKDFILSEVPDKMNARIAVDSKYWMWINDTLIVFEGGVKRGPNPYDTYYDSIDIAPFMRLGNNTISILVWYFGKQGFSYNPSGKAALFFEALSPEYSIVSDGTWLSFVHPSFYTPLGEKPNFRLPESNIGFDARKGMGEWFLSNVNLKTQNAKILGKEGDKPWNKLHHRVIPLWKDSGLIDYKSVVRKKGVKNDTLVCHLPYNAQITPYFKIKAHSGDIVSIKTDHYNGGGAINIRSEYIAKNGIQSYESLGWLNGHVVYYILPNDVEVIDLKYRETSYDTEFVGEFHCNDMALNKYWEKAKRTLLVTMRDTYMDCPDRERSQWWGDAVNESGETFYALCSKSHLLTKKAMYELIGWQRNDGRIYSPIPSSNWDVELPGQMLASIGYFGFWNYYLHTGDLQTIKDLYSGVMKYLNTWEKNPDGTVKVRQTAWVWGDWGINIDKEALFNAWYYIALMGAKNMAVALGLENDSHVISAKLSDFKSSFNNRFWNGTCYRSPSYKEETDDRVHALAVVSGLADSSQYSKILKVFRTQEYASPYMEKYVTEALFVMGEGEYGLKRMKKRFKEMIDDNECSTLYEGWGVGDDGYGGGSRNHAWSGGGLTILSQYVCGVSPLQPGYDKFMIKPCTAGLVNASTKMECVKGRIEVSWKKTKREFYLTVQIPERTECIVYIPNNGAKKIESNGAVIWKNRHNSLNTNYEYIGMDDDYIIYSLKPGKYDFIARK